MLPSLKFLYHLFMQGELYVLHITCFDMFYHTCGSAHFLLLHPLCPHQPHAVMHVFSQEVHLNASECGSLRLNLS